MYENFYVSTGTPTLAVERRYKMGLPLLLVASAVFAIVHIFVAYKTRCQARRKLYLRKIDLDGVSNGVTRAKLLVPCRFFTFWIVRRFSEVE